MACVGNHRIFDTNIYKFFLEVTPNPGRKLTLDIEFYYVCIIVFAGSEAQKSSFG